MTIHPDAQIVVPDTQVPMSDGNSSLVLNYSTNSSFNTEISQNQPVENSDISANVSVDIRQDVEVEDGIPGNVGIYNIGNTCFMNSSLQCILATKNLDTFFKNDFSNSLAAAMFLHPLIEQFQILFAKVYMGKYSVLLPKTFHETVASLHPLFGDFKQHDSQEFISFILNIIHDFVNLCQPHQSMLEDVSKRLKMDSSEMEIDEEQKAEKAWEDYIELNRSIISEQFQGQYQSVMTCGTCKFISKTYEPFMTLSLSIPFAMEKQIVVTWVSSPKALTPIGVPRIKRFLVTVKKNGVIEDLKKKLLDFLKQEEDSEINFSNIVLAEVRNHSHVKILDNKTQLKYLSKSFSVFAIEILNSPIFENNQDISNHDDSMTSPDDNGVATWHTCNICFEEKFEEDLFVHRSCNGALCADCLQATIQHNQTSGGQFPCPSCNIYIDIEGGYEPMLKKPTTALEKSPVSMEIDDSSTQQTWRTCSICLTETFDDEMRIHNPCGGLICHGCVGVMAGYHDNGEFPCPTCNVQINEKEYVKLTPSENESGKPVRQRKVMVPVLFRYRESSESKKKFTMFGSPHITCLPSQTTEEQVEEVINILINKYNVNNETSNEIVITDSSGTSCGLCDFTTNCTGCRLSDLAELKLKPGCCLSITFSEQKQNIVNTLNFSKDDESIKLLRTSDVVTLDECMETFVDVELLGEDNPWFCPKCKANQVSEKMMSVTQWPDTLIIHLKRFYFDEAQGSKISCSIDFPLSDLKVDIMTCPTISKKPRSYDLYGIVNHTGTLFGGHYTSFTKKPECPWYNFNDETFKEMCPTEDVDYRTEAYVLFYQAKD